jgi:hypothetical protein
MQWLPLYRVTPNDLRGIIKTQAAVFPFTFVIKSGRADFMVVSFKGASPPHFSTDWIAERTTIFESERLLRGMHWNPDCQHPVASLEGVLALILTGPEDIARMRAPLLYDDDHQRLSYSSGDRELLRRYEGEAIEHLSFAALPLTPFASLQRYFRQPIPAQELDEERASSLAAFGVPSPRRVSEAIERFQRERDPAAKSLQALAIAELYDGSLARDQAFSWIAKAIAAHATETRPEQLEAVRRITRHHRAVYAEEIRTWLQTLPQPDRFSPFAWAVETELRVWEQRDARRRSAYPWE